MSLYTLVLLVLLLVVSFTTASHFWGGTISYTPKGRNPDGSYRVELVFMTKLLYIIYTYVCGEFICKTLAEKGKNEAVPIVCK